MFDGTYQGGPFVDVLSPQGKDPLVQWRVVGRDVVREMDKQVKSFVVVLGGGPQNKIQLPKDEKKTLGLTQHFLVLQIYIPTGASFNMELVLADTTGARRRLLLSTSFKETSRDPLHCRVPLSIIVRNVWLNLAFDLADLMSSNFRGHAFRALEQIVVASCSRVRRVFTMRSAPTDTSTAFGAPPLTSANASSVEFGDGVGVAGAVTGEPLPRGYELPPTLESCTQLFTMERVRVMEDLERIAASGGPQQPTDGGGVGGGGDAFTVAASPRISIMTAAAAVGKSPSRLSSAPARANSTPALGQQSCVISSDPSNPGAQNPSRPGVPTRKAASCGVTRTRMPAQAQSQTSAALGSNNTSSFVGSSSAGKLPADLPTVLYTPTPTPAPSAPPVGGTAPPSRAGKSAAGRAKAGGPVEKGGISGPPASTARATVVSASVRATSAGRDRLQQQPPPSLIPRPSTTSSNAPRSTNPNNNNNNTRPPAYSPPAMCSASTDSTSSDYPLEMLGSVGARGAHARSGVAGAAGGTGAGGGGSSVVAISSRYAVADSLVGVDSPPPTAGSQHSNRNTNTTTNNNNNNNNNNNDNNNQNKNGRGAGAGRDRLLVYSSVQQQRAAAGNYEQDNPNVDDGGDEVDDADGLAKVPAPQQVLWGDTLRRSQIPGNNNLNNNSGARVHTVDEDEDVILGSCDTSSLGGGVDADADADGYGYGTDPSNNNKNDSPVRNNYIPDNDDDDEEDDDAESRAFDHMFPPPPPPPPLPRPASGAATTTPSAPTRTSASAPHTPAQKTRRPFGHRSISSAAGGARNYDDGEDNHDDEEDDADVLAGALDVYGMEERFRNVVPAFSPSNSNSNAMLMMSHDFAHNHNNNIDSSNNETLVFPRPLTSAGGDGSSRPSTAPQRHQPQQQQYLLAPTTPSAPTRTSTTTATHSRGRDSTTRLQHQQPTRPVLAESVNAVGRFAPSSSSHASPASRSSAANMPPPSSSSVPSGEPDEEELELVYDPILRCYFDPVSQNYYELR